MKSYLFNVSIMVISIAMTGCNMLPDISRSSLFREDIKEQEENQQKRLMQTQMTNFIAEWQEMKPAIIDLISLESDLQVILYQLEEEQRLLQSAVGVQSDIMLRERDDRLNNKQFASLPKINEKFVENRAEVADLTAVVRLTDVGLLETFNDALEAKPLSSFDQGADAALLASFSESTELKANNSLHSQIPESELQYADGLAAVYANEGVSTNKFSVEANMTPALMEKKFSLVSNPSLIVGKVENNQATNAKKPQQQSFNCRQLSASIGSGYALHLASYSKQSSAKAGWLGLVENFNTSLCGLTPVLKEVYVNGKPFFSLRAGGFQSKAEADSACAEIAETKQYCKSTRFDGTPL